jgi:hypothetical protein
MEMPIPTTEERLRHYLDANQVQRERMCLALLPLLGPYTRGRPRRPKGGPDGARDVEAIHEGKTLVWGAVGFRNGGGLDEVARRDAEEKFKSDLDNALKENPSLEGFVFFTNVDLTPTRKENLTKYAQAKNIKIIDIFDLELLRHVLDSPEGLIARLQFLGIPMTPTEQVALVAKFGTELQNAVTERFDRVEQTLAKMERFLDFQKPLTRLDAYIQLTDTVTSAEIGDQAIRLRITGLSDLKDQFSLILINAKTHPKATTTLVAQAFFWQENRPGVVVPLATSMSYSPQVLIAYGSLTISKMGRIAKIADLTEISLEGFCTVGIRKIIKEISVDANGYQLFNYVVDEPPRMDVVELAWDDAIPFRASDHRWVRLLKIQHRDVHFDPPTLSGRGFLPLIQVD